MAEVSFNVGLVGLGEISCYFINAVNLHPRMKVSDWSAAHNGRWSQCVAEDHKMGTEKNTRTTSSTLTGRSWLKILT